MGSSPISKKTINESFYDIIDTLCGRFIGLTPFQVLEAETRMVYNLYTDCIIHDANNKKKGAKKENAEWVTSKTATWH